jgi:hypothetical protein
MRTYRSHRGPPFEMKSNPRYLPTPEQIDREAARIRAGWNAVELRKRLGVVYCPYEFPTVACKDLFGNLDMMSESRSDY